MEGTAMTPQQVAELVAIVQRNTHTMFDEVIAKLVDQTPPASAAADAPNDPQILRIAPAPAAVETARSSFTLDNPAPAGSWEEIARLTNQTYKWPDGNVDQYDTLVTYRGTGGWDGLMLALGFLPNGDVTGFALGSGGGSKRGITYFFPADDFDTSREKVSMIRGGGANKKSGFAPDEQLPQAYAAFKTAILRDRVAGKWNVQAIVVDEHDHNGMLEHTALQAKLRGLGG